MVTELQRKEEPNAHTWGHVRKVTVLSTPREHKGRGHRATSVTRKQSREDLTGTVAAQTNGGCVYSRSPKGPKREAGARQPRGATTRGGGLCAVRPGSGTNVFTGSPLSTHARARATKTRCWPRQHVPGARTPQMGPRPRKLSQHAKHLKKRSGTKNWASDKKFELDRSWPRRPLALEAPGGCEGRRQSAGWV